MKDGPKDSKASAARPTKAKRGRTPLPPDPFGDPPRDESGPDRSFEPYKHINPGILGGLGT